MKRYGNLYQQIISLDNLRLADERARKGKVKSYGVRLHDKNREAHLLALHEALRDKTYHTSKYTIFKVYEPKEREIYRLPYYPDRIVHHAIMNVLEPIWHRTFTYNTYSCIKDRGIDGKRGAAKQVDKIIRSFEGRPLYCLKIDVRKFYPSIDHVVLKQLLRKKIKDADLLWLLDEIIDSAPGLPIGNYISQYMANLYLSYMMHHANEDLRIPCVEYADDIVFFADNKDTLHHVLDAFVRPELDALHLTLKSNYQIFPIARTRYERNGRSLDYLGYQFFRSQKLLRKSIKKRLCKRVSKLNRRSISHAAYKQSIASWLGWCKHSNSKHLLKTIINQKQYESIF